MTFALLSIWLIPFSLKHKMTFTGKYWEPANEHLNALGIHDILAGSIENELGENIRRHLRLRITE